MAGQESGAHLFLRQHWRWHKGQHNSQRWRQPETPASMPALRRLRAVLSGFSQQLCATGRICTCY